MRWLARQKTNDARACALNMLTVCTWAHSLCSHLGEKMADVDPTSVENQTETVAETEAKRDRNPARRKFFAGVALASLPGPIRSLIEYAQAFGPALIATGGILNLIGKIIDGIGSTLTTAGAAGVALQITEKP